TPGRCSAILLKPWIRPSLITRVITKLIGLAATDFILSQAFLMLSTAVPNRSLSASTLSPNHPKTGDMYLSYMLTIRSFMLDHLLPIQVKISRSFSHNQVATDLTRSHVGLRYFSQASLIPRTISSQWSPIQVKTFFRILSHNHMATAFTANHTGCRM